MPMIKYHAFRVNDPKKYDHIRYGKDKFGKGVDAVWGVKKGGTVEIQAIRFDKSKFSHEEAKSWMSKHKQKYISSHKAKKANESKFEENYKTLCEDIYGEPEQDDVIRPEGMTLTVKVKYGNSAMLDGNDAANAIKSYFARMISAIEDDSDDSGKIRDNNGNTVGYWEVEIQRNR